MFHYNYKIDHQKSGETSANKVSWDEIALKTGE